MQQNLTYMTAFHFLNVYIIWMICKLTLTNNWETEVTANLRFWTFPHAAQSPYAEQSIIYKLPEVNCLIHSIPFPPFSNTLVPWLLYCTAMSDLFCWNMTHWFRLARQLALGLLLSIVLSPGSPIAVLTMSRCKRPHLNNVTVQAPSPEQC